MVSKAVVFPSVARRISVQFSTYRVISGLEKRVFVRGEDCVPRTARVVESDDHFKLVVCTIDPFLKAVVSRGR